jgi:broad specificity phosphatase PhoE
MDELVLVRHAATDWSGRRFCGRTDLALTPDGLAAARMLGRTLATSLPPGTRIVSSQLLRARQTASAIAAVTGGDGFAIDDRWSETDFGTAEGLTYEELEAAHPGMAFRLSGGDVTIDWPGGETAAALRARVEAAWRDLVAWPGTSVVVSHGGPLRIAIALATGRPAERVSVPAPGAIWRLERDRLSPAPAGPLGVNRPIG